MNDPSFHAKSKNDISTSSQLQGGELWKNTYAWVTGSKWYVSHENGGVSYVIWCHLLVLVYVVVRQKIWQDGKWEKSYNMYLGLGIGFNFSGFQQPTTSTWFSSLNTRFNPSFVLPRTGISSSTSRMTRPDKNWPGKNKRLELSNKMRNFINLRDMTWTLLNTFQSQHSVLIKKTCSREGLELHHLKFFFQISSLYFTPGGHSRCVLF